MSTGDDRVAGMIPYKNPAALIAYYLGVFSVIPCFPIGIAAFVMGIIGLINVRREPQVRGTVHAWIGIVMGFLLGGLWTLVTIAGVVAAVLGSAG